MNLDTHISFVELQFVKPFADNKAVSVYKRRTLKKYKKTAGCYLIKENGKIVYAGMSQSCVVEALYRHFYEWNDNRGNGYRITYFDKLQKKNYTVTIIETSANDAPKFEQSLIMLLKPRDNRQMYEYIVPRIAEQYNINKTTWEPVDVEDF